MERCPRCDRMSAETNLYTGELVCYNRDCGFRSKGSRTSRVKCPVCRGTCYVPIQKDVYKISHSRASSKKRDLRCPLCYCRGMVFPELAAAFTLKYQGADDIPYQDLTRMRLQITRGVSE